MTELQLNKNCGNSPKNQLLQELTVAMALADVERLSDLVTADVQWTQMGRMPVSGSQSVCRALARLGRATALKIDHVISHGSSGAVDGVVVFRRKRRAFCHVFDFASAKGTGVSGITTYSIAVE
jgi:hypothetical protein